MSYTTPAQVKDGLSSGYWKSIKPKLTEDGYAFSDLEFTDEDTFLQRFIDRTALFIDSFIGGGPFASSGLLESINRWLAVYDAEMYIISGTADRVISVTINEDKKRAIQLLTAIAEGTMTVSPETVSSTAAPDLIQPDGDSGVLTEEILDDLW